MLLALSPSGFTAPAAQDLTTPGFPTTFRCVLDKHTRVLVIKLNDTTAIAYDTGKLHMLKVWEDKAGKLVSLTGPVYNGRHGRQPVSIGNTLVTERAPLFSYHSNTPSSASPQLHYGGHKITEGKATLVYTYRDAEGNQLATIEETPSIKKNIVSRSFRITLNKDHQQDHIVFNQPGGKKWLLNGKPLTTVHAKSAETVTLSQSLSK